MQVTAIIPARYASTRLPGKPLALIGDKTMLQWVYEAAKDCTLIQRVIIATDDERILNHAKQFNAEAYLTKSDHQSGTDRIAELVEKLQIKGYIINVQGDQPFLDPDHLHRLISFTIKKQYPISTLYYQKTTDENNPNRVKLVINHQNKVLYFSRSSIPSIQKEKQHLIKTGSPSIQIKQKIHIGIYMLSAEILPELCKLPPSFLEKTERLEQLRWMENGYDIYAFESDQPGLSVDTKEDLEEANKMLKLNPEKSR